MYSDNSRQAIKKILKECVTEGTFWSRHFQFDDVIDIWRETNRSLIRNREEPAPFDPFYIALQKFRHEYPKDFELAAEAFIHKLETRMEVARLEREVSLPKETSRRAPRVQRTKGGSIKARDIFSSMEQGPIELSIVPVEPGARRLHDYFNRFQNEFKKDQAFRLLSPVNNQLLKW